MEMKILEAIAEKVRERSLGLYADPSDTIKAIIEVSANVAVIAVDEYLKTKEQAEK